MLGLRWSTLESIVPRRAARVDHNHAEIIRALRAVGAEVTDTSRVGEGFPDLVVSYRNKWFVIEVKDGRKPPSAQRLTKAQGTWMRRQRASVWVVNSVEDALAAIGAVSDSGVWRKVL